MQKTTRIKAGMNGGKDGGTHGSKDFARFREESGDIIFVGKINQQAGLKNVN